MHDESDLPSNLLSERTLALYRELISLIKRYQQQPPDAAMLSKTLSVSADILQQVKSDPDIVCMLLATQNRALSATVNRAFASCILVALLGVRNRVNDSCCQLMLSAQISMLGLVSIENEAHQRQQINRLSNILKQDRLQVWEECLILTRLIQRKAYHEAALSVRLNLPLSLLHIANHLASSLHPEVEKTAKRFADCLRNVIIGAPQHWQVYFQPLLIYPGLIPPGSVCGLNTGNKVLILSRLGSQYLVRPVSRDPSDPDNMLLVQEQRLTRLGPPLSIRGFALIDLCWNQAWRDAINTDAHQLAHSASFKLDKPPPTLLSIQQHLNNTDINVDKLAGLISREPSLSKHVLDTASITNRQRLPVKEVKHGLMVHGYQKTNSLLIQQALLQRLNQHYFPLQAQFIQFTRLLTQLARGLNQGHSILAEEASCLVVFCCAGLFTSARTKGRSHWLRGSKRTFDYASLLADEGDNHMLEHAQRLSSAWQQPQHAILAIRHHASPGQLRKQNSDLLRLTYTLGLSLLLARRAYFVEQDTCPQSHEYLDQAKAVLGWSEAQLDEITQDALVSGHSFSPLQH